MISTEKKNPLREKLFLVKKDPFAANLFEEFNEIEKKAYQLWVPMLGHDKGSLSGPAHLDNVEAQACSILSKTKKVKLSPVESFVLLSSILYHDFGKVFGNFKNDNKKNSTKSNLKSLLQELIDDYESHSEKDKAHACQSAIGLMEGYRELGFSDRQLVECIAIVCAAHDFRAAKRLQIKGMLENIYLDHYGLIRLGWLSALLVFADEMDNSFHRAVRDWIKNDSENKKGKHRAMLNGCEIDEHGELMVVHLGNNFFEPLSDGVDSKDLYFVNEDLEKKYELLRFWKNNLCQMNLEILDVSIEYKGHLFKIKEPAPAEYPEKTRPEDYKMELLTPVVEPFVRQIKIDLVLDAALSLRLKSFGRTVFPWEALASEAGFENIEDVKIVFHRLSMLAKLYCSKIKRDEQHYIDIIRSGLAGLNFFDFIELDGEWSIDIGENFENDTLQKFYQWVSKIVSSSNNLPVNNPAASKSVENSEYYYRIVNKNLAYLLDEKEFRRSISPEEQDDKNFTPGIQFPETQSFVNQWNHIHNSGVNLVICGPPGVGKTTLAIELLNKGIMHTKKDTKIKSLFAYCSLEQQIDPIKKMQSRNIIYRKHDGDLLKVTERSGSHLREPDFIRLYQKIVGYSGGEDKMLIFPSLVPNIVNRENTKEENIFWYRYKQILRLIEGDRYLATTDDDHHRLAAIVIDSLNGFTQEKLHRSDLHQIFKRITWSGLLGIYILESSSESPIEYLQKEIEYLADIVIKLDWIRKDYQYKVMEISKSRNQRHVLGKHPYKIRRNENLKNDGTNNNDHQDSLFEIYPSIHTQVSRYEKLISPKNNDISTKFSLNPDLNTIVQIQSKNEKGASTQKEETGIGRDAFIILKGESGGHKLAIGMSYIHCLESEKTDKAEKTDQINASIIINLGQTIAYQNVADSKAWIPKENFQHASNLKLPISPKINFDVYYNSKANRIIFILNFHSGFLLPEEFIYIITSIIDDIMNTSGLFFAQIKPENDDDSIEFIKELNSRKIVIKRTLFNSAGHLPERYPLLDSNPLFLHAVARIFKKNNIGFMVIAVEGLGKDQQIKSLSAIADLLISVFRENDPKMPIELEKFSTNNNQLTIDDIKKENTSNIRIITSDNITGKDYSKRFGLLYVDNEKNLKVKRIERKQ